MTEEVLNHMHDLPHQEHHLHDKEHLQDHLHAAPDHPHEDYELVQAQPEKTEELVQAQHDLATEPTPELHAMATLFESAISTLQHHLTPVTQKMYNNEKYPFVEDMVRKVEAATGTKRENLAYGAAGFLTVYFLVGSLVQIVCNLVGFMYPAWASIKAVRSQSKEDDTKWLIYWIVFAFFSVLDFSVFSHIPFYWLAKAVFLMYLYLPHFKGANLIYYGYIDPACTVVEGYFTPAPKKDN